MHRNALMSGHAYVVVVIQIEMLVYSALQVTLNSLPACRQGMQYCLELQKNGQSMVYSPFNTAAGSAFCGDNPRKKPGDRNQTPTF